MTWALAGRRRRAVTPPRSVASPLAKGLLGREVGDEVKLQMPAGPRSYEILKISFK